MRRARLVCFSVLTILATSTAFAVSADSHTTTAHTINDVGEAIDTWFPRHGVDARAGRCVANRESGMNPTPRENIYSGVFQHLDSKWLERVRTYNSRNTLKTPNENWRDPTTQALVTAEMVSRGGWGPWPNSSRHCGLRSSRSRR